MTYESSYDVGLKPFNHDKKRGKWASPIDFLFACIGHAFKLDTMIALPLIVFRDSGILGLLVYLVSLTLCTIPLVFIQSFLGQFSSTGFISVFRIAPIFKGIGYAALALNVVTLAFYSIFAAIPMFFFIHSMRPTLPWSCEGLHWMKGLEKKTTHCNVSSLDLTKSDTFQTVHLPSLNFFDEHINVDRWSYRYDPDFTHSWTLTLCTIVIWLVVWAVLEKPTETIGRILRYSAIVVFGIIGICFLRFIFLPGALGRLLVFTNPKLVKRYEAFFLIPCTALAGLGPGWGSILSMASYNKFKTDVTKYSWLLCVGQLGLVAMTSFSFIFIENFITGSRTENMSLEVTETMWWQIISVPTGLSLLEMPNLWSLIFFGMITLGVFSLLVGQLFSVLTSLFDEFEQLRNMKTKVIRISVAVFGVTSILFCSNTGHGAFQTLLVYSVISQMFLNLLLLLVVLWIYGRERFQHDLSFMNNKRLPTWIVYVVRFITPLFLLFTGFFGILELTLVIIDYTLPFIIGSAVITLLPWLLVPGFCIFKLMQTSGSFSARFKRCAKPTDWYPADPLERQAYDETCNASQISYQLTTMEDEV